MHLNWSARAHVPRGYAYLWHAAGGLTVLRYDTITHTIGPAMGQLSAPLPCHCRVEVSANTPAHAPAWAGVCVFLCGGWRERERERERECVCVSLSLCVCVCAGVTAGLPKAAVELLALLLLTQKGA